MCSYSQTKKLFSLLSFYSMRASLHSRFADLPLSLLLFLCNPHPHPHPHQLARQMSRGILHEPLFIPWGPKECTPSLYIFTPTNVLILKINVLKYRLFTMTVNMRTILS